MSNNSKRGAPKKAVDDEKLNYLLGKGFSITEIAEKGSFNTHSFAGHAALLYGLNVKVTLYQRYNP